MYMYNDVLSCYYYIHVHVHIYSYTCTCTLGKLVNCVVSERICIGYIKTLLNISY